MSDAFHQAGQRADALERFQEAEAMQAERQSQYPLLYSLPGFQYCDLLLADAERVAWRARREAWCGRFDGCVRGRGHRRRCSGGDVTGDADASDGQSKTE